MAKKDMVIKEVLEVVKQYRNTKLTLRQIYYRLVAKLIIDNNINQYKYLSKILVEARKSGLVPYDIFEDRTRDVKSWIGSYYDTWRSQVEYKLSEVKDAPYISLHQNLYQEKITLIALEKQALEGIFRDAIKTMSILVVCRGYNSLTQLKELSNLLEKHPNKEVNIYFFSDFDPSGLDIQRNFKEQCIDLNINFNSFKRVALTEKQINDYSLPFAPTKLSDSRAKNWKYAGVVELDALEPNILKDMIKECCSENWNDEIYPWRRKLARVQNRRAKKHYAKGLRKILEELEEEE